MKMSFTRMFIFMQIKLISIWMVSHEDSFWNRGKKQLGYGLVMKNLSGSSLEICVNLG